MKLFLLILIFSFPVITFAQNNHEEFSVLFYNVENLFDCRNDSLTNDDEFTPQGERHWTKQRFENKIQHTAKAIIGSSGWQQPDLIGICEIENRYVLQRLLNDTPLKTFNYKIIHKESPDHRGIDVALLYNPKTFYPLIYEYFPLINDDGEVLYSREILYVSGVVDGTDTLHVFVNHWPSRYSGVMETRPLRKKAALLLKAKCDSLFLHNIAAKIIIIGDFNDQPLDNSICKHLKAQSVSDSVHNKELYNLSANWIKNESGTLKYKSQWYIFDQIIVSGKLLNCQSGFYTKSNYATMCRLPFLFEKDNVYGGEKLFRTYFGYKYNGGFSDHLPVLLKLGRY